jgi:hypothetical protein
VVPREFFFSIVPIAALKYVDVQRCSGRSSAIREFQIAHSDQSFPYAQHIPFKASFASL